MKNGDLLHVNGLSDDDQPEVWYAELVGVNEDDDLEVFFLEKTTLCDGYVWSYNGDWQTIPRASVIQVFSPSKADYITTYHAFGFMPTVMENQFLRVSDTIPPNILTPMPLDAEDSDSECGENEDMDDFIVDDEVANEPFTQAVPNNDFVRDVHQAVQEYNQWAPQRPEEKRVKDFIDSLALKYQAEDDNRQFAAGHSVDYNHPNMS